MKVAEWNVARVECGRDECGRVEHNRVASEGGWSGIVESVRVGSTRAESGRFECGIVESSRIESVRFESDWVDSSAMARRKGEPLKVVICEEIVRYDAINKVTSLLQVWVQGSHSVVVWTNEWVEIKSQQLNGYLRWWQGKWMLSHVLILNGCPSQDLNSCNSCRDDDLRVWQSRYEQMNEWKYNANG